MPCRESIWLHTSCVKAPGPTEPSTIAEAGIFEGRVVSDVLLKSRAVGAKVPFILRVPSDWSKNTYLWAAISAEVASPKNTSA